MFLRVKNTKIITASGEPVILKGVNLGGWLMMEGYILGGRNIPEQKFRKIFTKTQGMPASEEFTRLFRENFIQEKDFKIISELGFNCVRIPFNFRLIKQGFGYLEKAVELSKKYHLWVILDLHAAPGSQNQDWHSDSMGKALLWKDKRQQARLIKIWQFLAQRFRDESAIAGYDILNEGVCADNKVMLDLYKRVVKGIREIDKNHIIFLEGNKWAQDIDFLGKPWDGNMVYSIHFYMPLEFTFSLIRELRYPGKIGNEYWSKGRLKGFLNRYFQLKNKWQAPIFTGEFGQNSRCVYCYNEFKWLTDTLAIFKEFGFHWTYWTWKAIAQGVYPDGIYQYQDNPAWVCRQGPITGWETYYSLWKRHKKEICASWRTENFSLNRPLISLLKSFLK
ncbi:MAG: cellulase family glycosylhydrolase [Candidatus Omnitrophota bacterium]